MRSQYFNCQLSKLFISFLNLLPTLTGKLTKQYLKVVSSEKLSETRDWRAFVDEDEAEEWPPEALTCSYLQRLPYAQSPF